MANRRTRHALQCFHALTYVPFCEHELPSSFARPRLILPPCSIALGRSSMGSGIGRAIFIYIYIYIYIHIYIDGEEIPRDLGTS